MRIRNLGFTFVELLVVITVIALLMGVAVTSFATLSKNSRDVRRRTDIESIRSALELCRSEDGSYPLLGVNGLGCADGAVTCGGETFMAETPHDPKEGGTFCYIYTRLTTTTYTITCDLEKTGETCSYAQP